jgi:hypothetical protein
MLPVGPRAKGPPARNRRWGVILAGGDGTRLRSLTRFISGDNRPKQFCPLFDACTLLGHTVRRAERSIPAAQTLFALTHAHRDFYSGELDNFRSQRIVQPANKGTPPPILFSALSIARMDENASWLSCQATIIMPTKCALRPLWKQPSKLPQSARSQWCSSVRNRAAPKLSMAGSNWADPYGMGVPNCWVCGVFGRSHRLRLQRRSFASTRFGIHS